VNNFFVNKKILNITLLIQNEVEISSAEEQAIKE